MSMPLSGPASLTPRKRADLFHSRRTPNSICRHLSHLGIPYACQPLHARYPPCVSRPALLHNPASPAAPASRPGTGRAKNQKSHQAPNPIFGHFDATACLVNNLYVVEKQYRSSTLSRRSQLARKADFSEVKANAFPGTPLVQARFLGPVGWDNRPPPPGVAGGSGKVRCDSCLYL